jgi:hypothetical protein
VGHGRRHTSRLDIRFTKMRIVFMRMINKTQDVIPRNIINLSDITRHWE